MTKKSRPTKDNPTNHPTKDNPQTTSYQVIDYLRAFDSKWFHVVPPKKDICSSPSLVRAFEKNFNGEKINHSKLTTHSQVTLAHIIIIIIIDDEELLNAIYLSWRSFKKVFIGLIRLYTLFSTTYGSKSHLDMVAMSYVITRRYNIRECHIKLACNCPFIDILLYVDHFATCFYMESDLLWKFSKEQ